MFNLFMLYRYLSKSRDLQDPTDPYTMAYQALEQFVKILDQLESWGESVRTEDSLEYEDTQTIHDLIMRGHKTALCELNDGSSAKALLDFAASSVNLVNDYEAIMVGLDTLRAQQIDDAKALEEGLGEIEDHPF